MTEFQYEIKIPKERIAVLIGKNGETKKEIEDTTKIKLSIDSKEGDVFLMGDDALGLYSAREVIRAIGRGFNPENALLLLRQDYGFEIVDVTEYCGKEKNNMVRVKGRVIGREGKTRHIIEELSECLISVYGKTISIIGPAEFLPISRRAIEMLLEGTTHANAYKFLEKKRRDIKKERIIGM